MYFYRLKRKFGQGENMAALLKRQSILSIWPVCSLQYNLVSMIVFLSNFSTVW